MINMLCALSMLSAHSFCFIAIFGAFEDHLSDDCYKSCWSDQQLEIEWLL